MSCREGRKTRGTLLSTLEVESHPLSSPPEIGRDRCLLNSTWREEVARAIVALTIEDDFHRQADYFRSCRKIQPISTATWDWEQPLLKGQSWSGGSFTSQLLPLWGGGTARIMMFPLDHWTSFQGSGKVCAYWRLCKLVEYSQENGIMKPKPVFVLSVSTKCI